MRRTLICFATLALMVSSVANAEVIELNLLGNAGFGLLPGNEIGANTADASTSNAFGGEIGQGFVLDTNTGLLQFGFQFSGLTGGLFNAASGIHIHEVNDPSDPFNSTGGILFNLNSGSDANVTLTTPLIDIGSTSGTVEGTIALTDTQEQGFVDGIYYINIHSDSFRGGELRANVTAIPEPSSCLAIAACLITSHAIRRRRRVA
ncbi:MAG: CHRD domain-containing protein [Planctomycetota bacterium]